MPIQRTYIDLNESFLPHPATGDLTRVFDGTSIAQSIKNLILTNHYETLFGPWKGANLTALLFEPATPIIIHAIESRIRSTIEAQEPRATVIDIKLNYNESINAYTVGMSFSIIGLDLPTSIDFLLERAR